VTLTTTDGQSKTVKLTVLANQKSIDGHDYMMHVGDATPTVDNFGGQATDIDGKVEAVSVDLSGADVTKAGIKRNGQKTMASVNGTELPKTGEQQHDEIDGSTSLTMLGLVGLGMGLLGFRRKNEQ
ncbi:LPXTG cell wall anchor domain-containing protein, partial [Furfurilactobacillus sp. WILCCON 0119]